MNHITPTLSTLLCMKITSSKSAGSKGFHHTILGGLPQNLCLFYLWFPSLCKYLCQQPLHSAIQCLCPRVGEWRWENIWCLWPLWTLSKGPRWAPEVLYPLGKVQEPPVVHVPKRHLSCLHQIQVGHKAGVCNRENGDIPFLPISWLILSPSHSVSLFPTQCTHIFNCDK